jgi:NADPH:quinone reductase-like Zn-dependent oxidoreductase
VVAERFPASFEEAAALPLASLTALQALRDLARVRPGDRVLIHGASGGVGVHAIQLARGLGAEVTTTCSAANLELCRSLGASRTLDYRAQDPLSGDSDYRAIFDVFGNLGFPAARRALAERGTYVGTVPRQPIFTDQLRTVLARKRARLVVVRSRRADLEVLAAEVAAGRLRPVIDSVFSLEEVARAQDRIATKRCRGKVVLRVG